MFYIKQEINGYNANDLFNFIDGATAGDAIQIKIEKAWFDNSIVYKAEVRNPGWSDRFVWDWDAVPSLNVESVASAVALIKTLTETGFVIVWVDGERIGQEKGKRNIVIEYFAKDNDVELTVEEY